MNAATIEHPRKITLSEVLAQQVQERGLQPLPLDADLLIKHIRQGGHSGKFLADAFISAYRTNRPFNHSLGELTTLDAQAFRLFHQVLHIRHVPGWQDNILFSIEQQILEVRL